MLEADLIASDVAEADGSVLYCFTDAEGRESPNLRVNPGDLVVLHLKNALTDLSPDRTGPDKTSPDKTSPDKAGPGKASDHAHAHMPSQTSENPCTSGMMSPVSTNLHFHGLTIPPVCHQDDVMKTSVQPGDAPFEYRFRIPDDEPPGLYWYHPHIHGFAKQQLLGGASGALIVEGAERAKKVVVGLPERVFIIRDQDLVNPNASPAKSEPVVPKFMIDRDGDAANNGTGFGKPAKDLSINYVPVPYPDYTPAVIEMKPGERQLWRVLNASAITYLNLAVLVNRAPQQLGLVAMDGVPMSHGDPLGEAVNWQTHIGLPPGARVEFIVSGPADGETGLLVTRTVDTGPGGENDPNRALAKIVTSADAPEPRSRLASSPEILPAPSQAWIGTVAPVRVRRLYFSEKLIDPNDPTSAVEFYLTMDGQEPKMFDMSSDVPNIVAQQGTVEDWIIENRSQELHAFHIHQLHFLLLDYMGRQVNENFVRDTVNVPYYDGHSLAYPSVRLRMDFRDPNIVGTFVYHCHLLEHEDKGMMGSIRVDPAPRPWEQNAESSCGKALPCKNIQASDQSSR
ncbi:Multicopper oxidase [Acidisarcina polymorpha]|uniref:Multicopper oxidase n=1 Tax=Acidisarcina polymorpha TaxID=2211140 RepID=A0A2Z5G259_9BACT|nr:multicopper oxidase domain-containing protein [Acidisarcina polymorpha]AXC12827.1 Multicopper oxidase [Acidisarcina polymorpha]